MDSISLFCGLAGEFCHCSLLGCNPRAGWLHLGYSLQNVLHPEFINTQAWWSWDNEKAKVEAPKPLEASLRGHPMSLLPYSIGQMKSQSQAIVKGQKNILILIKGIAKDTHTEKCNSLRAGLSNNLPRNIYFYVQKYVNISA